mgnify:CR=1 FL=1
MSDIEAHLARLITPTFVRDIARDQLQHVPRYLKAHTVRLDRLKSGGAPALARDQSALAEWTALWQSYERRARDLARAGVQVNLVMWAFNLFPLPPLDGGRILVGLLPWRQAQAVARIEPWGFFIVMGLVIAGIVGTWWLRPLMSLGYSAIGLLLTPLQFLLN